MRDQACWSAQCRGSFTALVRRTVPARCALGQWLCLCRAFPSVSMVQALERRLIGDDQPDADQRIPQGPTAAACITWGELRVLHLRQSLCCGTTPRDSTETQTSSRVTTKPSRVARLTSAVPCVAGIDRGALDAEEYPDGVEHGGFHWRVSPGPGCPRSPGERSRCGRPGLRRDEQGDRQPPWRGSRWRW